MSCGPGGRHISVYIAAVPAWGLSTATPWLFVCLSMALEHCCLHSRLRMSGPSPHM